ncbi:MAG TPA: hypothetical protein VFF04_01890 [Candidatus Babeliales bacterium]|nr:hypothetical protein [Candidatus Babeliales bacterium]
MFYTLIICAGVFNSASLLLGAQDASKLLKQSAMKSDHHDMTLLQHIDASERIAAKSLIVTIVDPVASLHKPSSQLRQPKDKKTDNPEKDQSIECSMCGKTISIYEIGPHLKKHELSFDPNAVAGAIKMIKEDAL